MQIRDLSQCREIIAGDHTTLRELLNPGKEELPIRYSLAHAVVKPGKASLPHQLESSEVYYVLQGKGRMHIGRESAEVGAGQAVLIPPGAVQRIENTGTADLVFLCIVDPAWKAEEERIGEE